MIGRDWTISRRAGGVPHPLDVLRCPEVVRDPTTQPGQLTGGSRRPGPGPGAGRARTAGLRGAGAGRGRSAPPCPRSWRSVTVSSGPTRVSWSVFTRPPTTASPSPQAAADQHRVAAPGARVGGEHARPRTSASTSSWTTTARLDLGRVDALTGPVRHGPRGPQRGPAAAYGVQHRVGAADVEVGVLLAGEAGPLEVLGRRRGAYGHGVRTRARDRPPAMAAARSSGTRPAVNRSAIACGSRLVRARIGVGVRSRHQGDDPVARAGGRRRTRGRRPWSPRSPAARAAPRAPAHRGWPPCRRPTPGRADRRRPARPPAADRGPRSACRSPRPPRRPNLRPGRERGDRSPRGQPGRIRGTPRSPSAGPTSAWRP